MSGQKKPQPVNLWLPEYYNTPVSELFGPDKQFDIDEHKIDDIAHIVAEIFWGGFSAHDPHGIMAEFGKSPTVRVSNHHSMTDPPVLEFGHLMLGADTAYFAAMAELFKRPRIAERIAKIGGFPVDRARMQARESAVIARFFEVAKYILMTLGKSVVVFPQGGITSAGKDGIVEDINPGAALLARKAKVPLIVSAVDGNRHAGAKLLFGPRATVYIHEVFEPDDLPTTERLQNSMQIAVQRAAQYHENRKSD